MDIDCLYSLTYIMHTVLRMLIVMQIADFGLSRDLQNENFYLAHGGKIPVKWTAPEALQYRLYSAASDVWSYGVVLYEIWSLGERPYHDLTNDQVCITVTL